MRWDVMSGVCGMAFSCGSTLIKVPLLQVGIVTTLPKMFKKRRQTPTKISRQGNGVVCIEYFTTCQHGVAFAEYSLRVWIFIGQAKPYN